MKIYLNASNDRRRRQGRMGNKYMLYGNDKLIPCVIIELHDLPYVLMTMREYEIHGGVFGMIQKNMIPLYSVKGIHYGLEPICRFKNNETGGII